MPLPNRFTRRAFIQRATLASLAVGSSGALAACASSGGGDDTFEGEKSSDNPFGVQADAPLDVVIFKGGYGDDYAKFHEELYNDAVRGRRDHPPRHHRHPPADAAALQRRQPARRPRQRGRRGDAASRPWPTPASCPT